jgi:PAS domain S-box-containing protein
MSLFQTFSKRVTRVINLKPFRSIGTKLFLHVLSGVLVGLGGMSYFFAQTLEHHAEDDIQHILNTQVELLESQLGRIEESTTALAAAVTIMHQVGIKEAEDYKKLAFQFFQIRPPLVMGNGFGQRPFQIIPKREWYWPYFYVDQGVANAIGEWLPAPYYQIRYTDLFREDNYPQQSYYTEPVTVSRMLWTEPYDWYGITMLSCLTPFFDDNTGVMLGVARSDVDVTDLSDQVSGSVLQGSGYFVIISRQGYLLSYPPDPKKVKTRATYQQVPLLNTLGPQLQTGDNGSFDDSSGSQEKTFFAYQRIPQTGWLMLAIVPHSVITIPVFLTTVAGTVGAGAVLLLVVILFIRGLNARLQVILQECKKLAGTTLMAPTDSDQSSHLTQCDEVGVLTQTFHEMAQQLRTSLATLAQQNAELQGNEQRLRQFLEAIPIGVAVLEASGRPYYLNRLGRQLLGQETVTGVTQEQLPKTYQFYVAGTDQLYPPEKLTAVQALQGKTAMADDIEIHQSDRIIPIESRSTPIFNEQGQIIYATVAFQDITERRRTEQERFRSLQELGSLNATLCELNEAYERFVPRELLKLLGQKSIIELQLGDHVEQEMTVLFADIRGFTSISEKMTPRDLFEFLNNYLGQMAPIIVEHHGVVDKYIGDAIMAVFPSSADDAVRAALAMLKTVAHYNILLQRATLPLLHIGIGLNTGPLMLGIVGGLHRMEATVIADAVNLAARVEDLTKVYRTSLLITQQTYLKLEDPLQYHIRVIDTVTVKGKLEEVSVYEVYDADPPETRALKDRTREEVKLGFRCYHGDEFTDALRSFAKVWQDNENDTVAQIYLERCHEILGMKMPDFATILVVEDTSFDLEILSIILKASHFKVLVAHDGESALTIAEAQAPHLILLDVMMRGIDGFETCRRLKKQPRTKDIPVIFMTGLADNDSKMKGFAVGAVDYITKPFQREELLARIKAHLYTRYLRQQLVKKL